MPPIKTKTKRYCSIDFIKGIAAISIVCLHCANNDAFDSTIHLIGRMAVPMFFIITGYFLTSMIKSGHITNHIKKITKVAIGALAFYFPLFCIEAYLNGNLKHQLLNIFRLDDLWEKVIFSQYPFYVNAGHLWYLIAVIYILGFVYFYTKKYRISTLYILIPLLFIIGYLISSFEVTDRRYYQNFLFIGLPYILLGSFIREQLTYKKISNRVVGLSIVIFSILYLVEIALYLHIGLPARREHYLCIIPLVSFILIWAVQNPTFGENHFITTIGKDYSIYIYVFHLYFVRQMWFIFHGSPIDSKLQMLFSIFLALSTSFLYVKHKKFYKQKFHH